MILYHMYKIQRPLKKLEIYKYFCETFNETRVLYFKNQLCSLRMSEGYLVTDHHTKLKNLRDQLIVMGKKT
jgi:hypothetical protein